MNVHDQPHVRAALARSVGQLQSRCGRCEDKSICPFWVPLSDYSAHTETSVHKHGVVVEVMISRESWIYLVKNLLQCHSVQHESHTNHPGFSTSLASKEVRDCRHELREGFVHINCNNPRTITHTVNVYVHDLIRDRKKYQSFHTFQRLSIRHSMRVSQSNCFSFTLQAIYVIF